MYECVISFQMTEWFMQRLHSNSDRTHVDCLGICAQFASDARLVTVFATDMNSYICHFLYQVQ